MTIKISPSAVDKDILICFRAIKYLRSTPLNHEFRQIRMKYADQMEISVLMGYVENYPAIIELCKAILKKAYRVIALQHAMTAPQIRALLILK